MQREIQNRTKKDEQDILWEELEEQFENIRKAYKKGRLNLNQVVIEKSALYLKVENYIDNVKDKTESKNLEVPKRLINRIRTRKYKNNQVADFNEVRLTTSINDDLFNNTDIENQILRKKCTNGTKENDEEIKVYHDITENNMSDRSLINFDRSDKKCIEAKKTMNVESVNKYHPNNFVSLKLVGLKDRVLNKNPSDQDSTSKVHDSGLKHRRFTEGESNLLSIASRLYQHRKSSISRISVEASNANLDQESEDSVELDPKLKQVYFKEVRKKSKHYKTKENQRRITVGKMNIQPLERKKHKKAKLKRVEKINFHENSRINCSLEQSIDLDSIFDQGTFGNDSSTINDKTINENHQIQESNNMLFVKSKSSKGKKIDSRYEHRLSSEISNDQDSNEINIKEFNAQEDNDYGYTQNKMETIDKGKGFNNYGI